MTIKKPIWILAAALSLAACSSGPQQILINGGGATFPYPMYSKWFDEYHKLFPNVQINYQSQGSGFGVKQVTEGTVTFGASDQPMTDEQIAEFRQKRNTNILHFPTVLGADVPTYNVPGVSTDLNFTPEALAGIFLGKITKWNDKAITSANAGVKLPSSEIVVVHRSDGSGTSYIWTDYLSKVSDEWKTKVGKGTSVNWPVGLGGKGNEGVSGQIKQTPNSIGYVELIYAVQNKMTYGKVRNRSGAFVKADLMSVTAAAAGVEMPDDFRVSITDPTGPDAYPIASFTWLLIPEEIQDKQKMNVMRDFLKWMLGPGQGMTVELLYAPLPQPVVTKEQAAIAKIH
ncbi:MAG: phosphate transporter substrate-binding protein PhoT family [Bryobacterales bacterium]|nr:phosphate transporter substrate-binding protein PhoT family [Bryobacterales bacterium]